MGCPHQLTHQRPPCAAAVLRKAADFPAAAPATPNRRLELHCTRTLHTHNEAWCRKRNRKQPDLRWRKWSFKYQDIKNLGRSFMGYIIMDINGYIYIYNTVTTFKYWYFI